jgi:hypothetical protein
MAAPPFCLVGLKGPHMSAQGNALGLEVTIAMKALKGRNRICVRILVAPFQGILEPCISLPRALPWADMLMPH